jgi:hypothetical protein
MCCMIAVYLVATGFRALVRKGVHYEIGPKSYSDLAAGSRIRGHGSPAQPHHPPH